MMGGGRLGGAGWITVSRCSAVRVIGYHSALPITTHQPSRPSVGPRRGPAGRLRRHPRRALRRDPSASRSPTSASQPGADAGQDGEGWPRRPAVLGRRIALGSTTLDNLRYVHRQHENPATTIFVRSGDALLMSTRSGSQARRNGYNQPFGSLRVYVYMGACRWGLVGRFGIPGYHVTFG
jgi:hypothetical protein